MFEDKAVAPLRMTVQIILCKCLSCEHPIQDDFHIHVGETETFDICGFKIATQFQPLVTQSEDWDKFVNLLGLRLSLRFP